MGINLKSRIFRSMFCLAGIFIVISAALSTCIMYKNTEQEIVQGNKTEAAYLKCFAETYGEEAIVNMDIPSGKRVTLISEDGKVIFDSKADGNSMGSHEGRPEFIDAIKYGYGEDKRVSDTMADTSYYYAVKLESGNVLRVATTADSIYESFKDIIPVVLGLSIPIIIAAICLAKFQTRKIVEPINNINIGELEKVTVYDEMTPFINRIKKQNKIINEYVADLRAKTIEFETIVENMREGLIVLSKEGHVITYNNSAIQLLEVGKIYGEVSSALLFNRSSFFENAVNQALQGNCAECKISFEEKICHIMANPVMDEGKIKGAVVLVIDITEKEKRDVLRREFSANVSHELRTPLTSISGYAEIMKTGMVNERDMVSFSGIIYSEAKRLINLVGDIIKISKLDEENVYVDVGEIDIAEIAGEIINRLRPMAKERNVELNLTVKENMSYNMMSVEQIADEVIYNIVENAIKYNKDGGRADVSISSDEKNIVVKVADTGIGIPKSDVGRVFERFYRVDKSHSKSIGGTGLWLSIVKHGAAYLGANVEIESEECVGTTITVTFDKKSFEK